MNPIIKKYINFLTTNDVNKFALKNDILLNKQELETIYHNLKTNLDEIIYDSEKAFTRIKDKLTVENYQKIHSIFDEYKKRYKDYL